MAKTEKPTLSCRAEKSVVAEVDAIAKEIGQSRSEWLYNLVLEALGKTPVATVQKMNDRITALEKKLSRLAS